MKREEAQEYTLALAKIVSGAYRQIRLAKPLGVPQALGLSHSEWVTLLNKEVCAAANDRLQADGPSSEATRAIVTAICNALCETPTKQEVTA